MTSTTVSTEEGSAPGHLQSYRRLAAFIARDADRSTCIYRSFRSLSARNILYLESELAELECKQEELDNQDVEDMHTIASAASWKTMSESTREKDVERVNVVREIRRIMREYHEALVLEEAVLKMSPPETRTLVALRHWFTDATKDGHHDKVPILEGRARYRLDDANDLIALRVSPDQDRLTKFVRQRFSVLFADTDHVDDSVVSVSEKTISKVVAAISIMVVAILLIGAIVNLYLVTSANMRLWLIASYMIGFALSMTLLTNARRPEIFGATAAYAAVLVVFVSGNLGTP